MSLYSVEAIAGMQGKKALEQTKAVHDGLGSSGAEYARINAHGEQALRVDLECEKAVLRILKRSGLPIQIFSEEHGEVLLGSDQPEFTAYLDGLDGTAVFKTERGKGRYGTMLGIYRGANPRYGDYLFGGVMEHSTNRLFWATRGSGSWIEENGKRSRARTSDQEVMRADQIRMQANMHFDRAFDSQVITKMLERLPGYNEYQSMNSTAVHMVDLASGLTELMLESTRKGNLEFAAGLPLIVEAGGMMIDLEGRDLRDLVISQFGQREYTGVVGLCNPRLRDPFLRIISAY